ncbi:MAG: hypothetical protein ABI574_17595 [Burkholderiales bacterium]
MSDDFFAPPPFKADDALQRLRRDLRELGLTERAGTFEHRGQPVLQARVVDAVLDVAMVREPARTPQWLKRPVRSSAELRDLVAELKKQLARWKDRDD